MLAVCLFLIALLTYLVGALPVGVIIRRIHKVDVSKHGSGKMGTTNVLRTWGRRAAALVLLGDFLKGSVAVVVARLIAGAIPDSRISVLGLSFSVVTLASLLAAGAAIAGHVWSIYMRLLEGEWRGGRGVATALGAVLVVNPLVVLGAVAVGVPTILISRYVSLGSILGAAAGGLIIIVLVLVGQMEALSLLFVLIAAFIILAHRDNIERLLKGTERKLGERAKI